MMLAQSAFWTGIFYDPAALAAAAALTRDLGYERLLQLRSVVPISGINTKFENGTLRDLARAAVAIAADGLRARGIRNAEGVDERIYLAPLQEIVAGGPTQAEHWLRRYEGAWRGDISRVFSEAAF
jgi:glutamate--cysteine ligase